MRNFFINRGFSFGTEDSDIRPSEMNISENEELSKKLKGNIFIYNCPPQVNTSFYLITTPLVGKELFEVRRYIWNEDKYDLYFLADRLNNDSPKALYYAKANPKINENTIKIVSFSGDKEDLKKLEKVHKWEFESGTFWLAYGDFLRKIKKNQRIDKKLIERLKELRKKLHKTLGNETVNSEQIVQALIDRTLFIKFLEDNHIINSFFYQHHFPKYFSKEDFNNNDFGYKTFLKNCDVDNLNKLFGEINKLFSNVLFEKPIINEKYLNRTVVDLIYATIRQYDWKTTQLSLFDFRFDVIPIEFISHIYEVFLENKQLNEGIYYTPPKLAHLIIDDTITELGSILDPSCGSGMFLILAFRKLLKYSPIPKNGSIYEKIAHKNEILKKYIFGIEKQNIAWRLSIFSLYLEILKGLPPKDIKEFIKQKLKSNSPSPLFDDFSANILERNALEVTHEYIPHKDRTFDFIVGNPPFVEVTSENDEISFINNYKTKIGGEEITSKQVVGYNQISQAFMLKIKDWAKLKTRFGFVQNSSNFYNEESKNFRNFFFTYYQVENFYELSRVHKILFRKAKEKVVVTIFTNNRSANQIFDYYPVDLEIFSEDFDLLVIHEDSKIELSQKAILEGKIILRDYLIGNQYDLKLIKKLSNASILKDYLITKNSFRGLERATNQTIIKHFELQEKSYRNLSKKKKTELQEKFASEKYLSLEKTRYYTVPYIYDKKNISPFKVNNFDGFLNNKDVKKPNFRRPKNLELFQGEKILFNRFGNKIEAAFVAFNCFFSTYIYVIKLRNKKYYRLFTAILNSDLINYYLTQKFRKRIDSNFANLDLFAIKNIPIPTYIDEDIAFEISEISHQLSEGELKYKGETKEKLNELIYDLYELNILEINRIRHFFAEKRKANENDLDAYKKALFQTIHLSFENTPIIEYYQGKNLPFGLIGVVLYFDNNKNEKPTIKKTLQYTINEILETTDENNLLTMKEKIYGNNCVYIIKDNYYHSWTTTKAFEDGREIVEKIHKLTNEKLHKNQN